MGGVVAFEMARQLQQSGQEVARVLLLDSHVPSRTPLATWDESALMVAFAWDLVGHAVEDLPVSIEQFRSLGVEEQLQLTFDLARSAGVIPASMGLEGLRLLSEVHHENLRAFLGYRPQQPYAGRVHLFRVSGEGANGSNSGAAWGDLSLLPVEEEIVPGDHYTILTGDHARLLAERLGNCLDRGRGDIVSSVLDVEALGPSAQVQGLESSAEVS